MKQISLFIPLLGTLLLSGCAGTSTEFECNATTSDTCMTMEQFTKSFFKSLTVQVFTMSGFSKTVLRDDL
jgi:uncharacterized lipoprotein YajG